MTRLRACFHFDIGELLVRRGELGASYQLREDPLVRLGLPGADPPFVLGVDREGRRDDPFSGATVGSAEHPPELVGVRIVQVNVELEADLSASEFCGADDDAPFDRAFKVWDRAYAYARTGYQQFRAWARVAGGQYWIGMAHDEPEFAGIQTLEDLDAGQRIPVGYPPVGTVMAVFSQGDREQMPMVADIVDAMATADEPPIATTFLADAQAIYWPKTRTGRDHQRAVLLAAIACEVRVKERLRELAPTSQVSRLVEIIVGSPREVTQSVPQLLRGTCEAITGYSLFVDDRDLWDAIDRLFRVRNRVAHRGHVASAEEAQAGVMAAVRLFSWLAELA